jgi:hypothetical protein
VHSWLNKFRGWRLTLVIWLVLCGPALLFGRALWGLFWQGTQGPGFPLVALWCVLAMLPFAALAAALRRGRYEGDRLARGPSWRVIAAVLLFVANDELNSFTDQRRDWPQIHRFVGVGSMLLLLTCFGLLVSAWFRRRQEQG